MIDSILIGTDGSAAAAAAENFSVALARRLRARLLGISVVEERQFGDSPSGRLGLPPKPLNGVENWLKARADAA